MLEIWPKTSYLVPSFFMLEELQSFFEPALVETPVLKTGDPRVGHLLGRGLKDWTPPRVALLGYPSDAGVRRNAGRVGASFAPDLIREAFFRLTPDARNHAASCALFEKTLDLGNLKISEDVEADQNLLSEVVAQLLEMDVIPIILGGGHELSFGHFKAYVRNNESVSIFNFDSHPDVRELIDGKAHSGSPFRQALLDSSKLCAGYSVFGLQPYALSNEHLMFLEDRECHCHFQDELNEDHIRAAFSNLQTTCMVSFDIDVLCQGIAPGVSARVRGNMPLEQWNLAAFESGKSEKVKSLDLVECNPKYDSDHATSRLAAQTIWHFLRGVGLRQRH